MSVLSITYIDPICLEMIIEADIQTKVAMG